MATIVKSPPRIPVAPSILTINAGSSSIKFAVYQTAEPLQRTLHGTVERIGMGGTTLTFQLRDKNQADSRRLDASDHKSAAAFLLDWLEEQEGFDSLQAVGHRVVHGMRHTAPEIVTLDLLTELHRISPYDPDHLPSEIELIEMLRQRHPNLPQVACFDTAFHQHAAFAKLLPIPRRYDAKGVQRYGFHGLSYAYLMEELARLGDPAARSGRVILAHLGNGASMAAVLNGVEHRHQHGLHSDSGTSHGHPLRRSGSRPRALSGANRAHDHECSFSEMVNHESGLLGVSEISSDMRDLLARESRGRPSRGSRRAVLLSGEEVDRLVRRCARGTGYPRLRRRYRENCASGPQPHLRRAGLPRDRAEHVARVRSAA